VGAVRGEGGRVFRMPPSTTVMMGARPPPIPAQEPPCSTTFTFFFFPRLEGRAGCSAVAPVRVQTQVPEDQPSPFQNKKNRISGGLDLTPWGPRGSMAGRWWSIGTRSRGGSVPASVRLFLHHSGFFLGPPPTPGAPGP